MRESKVLIFIVAYNAEEFIINVLERIPHDVWNNDNFYAEVLIIDDQSTDNTFDIALEYANQNNHLPIVVLYNPQNQGYGGNQKIGYYYALSNDFDIVVLLHGDGQYAPELLPNILSTMLDNNSDVIMASRMVNKFDALKGRMPLYKWIGNQVLTYCQNRILGTELTEFHTGYRAYRVSALETIPFAHNSNYFDFDTDIIIQLVDTNKVFKEVSIPTYYGDEVSRVNGFKYAWLILKSSLQSRFNKIGIFYHPKFDYDQTNLSYTLKLGYDSSHQLALDYIENDTTVLDIGCGPGYIAQELYRREVTVVSIDREIHETAKKYSSQTIEVDINDYDFSEINIKADTILLLDIIEHLVEPEVLLLSLREKFAQTDAKIIITTGNISFCIIRIALLFGQFNYGKKGILDKDHKRLYTFASLRRMLIDQGYEVIEEKGISAPFPVAFGHNWFSKLCIKVNRILMLLARNLFSYQMAFVVKPQMTLAHLLAEAEEAVDRKIL